MRWTREPLWSFNNWQRWFAWYPVRVPACDERHEHWVWLEWVERKEYIDYGGGGWDHRLPVSEQPTPQ